jgi:dihydrofolate reductase
VANKRKIIVHIATSADGYIARPDGDLEWLTKRPAPKGFYGIGKFMNSIDTKLLGRKT